MIKGFFLEMHIFTIYFVAFVHSSVALNFPSKRDKEIVDGVIKETVPSHGVMVFELIKL